MNCLNGGDDTPLFQNSRVVSSEAVEAVNALYDNSVAVLGFAKKFFVLRTVKIFATLFVDEYDIDAEIF